ncbi:MAG TPA: Asp-tRNA(Asn)/Glu-tRNA(Gln) amidotransferase subunit GatB [Phototrophicaceae bacterium]|nr:Asp-tRNA(Asn)/Glu-tRNA(Gln) amidotransferase subunit GatB [Phototrophicaceae bacterium]
MSDWKPVIGLEIHAELMTASKMFSSCPVVDSVEAAPNTAVDPVSLGLPGTLPVINRQAVEFGIMVGLALHCEIPPMNQFARKNYFYPDLPKGYQISQYERPLAINGWLDIQVTPENGEPYTKHVRIRRAHLEEDTGKLTHIGGGSSLVDYNRAGVPLLEIVTEPDINSAEEAEAFGRTLRAILQYLGVNNGDMSKGVLRMEPNISVLLPTDPEYRTRTEVKNLNSIRNVYRAIQAETERQIKLWESGGEVKQATLGWDEAKQRVVIQRYKERADEYRYFPEPDLPIVEISRDWVEAVRARLPELPEAKRQRFMDAFGLSDYDARQLVAARPIAHYYEAVLTAGANPKSAANWILGGLFALMNEKGLDREEIEQTKITAAQFAELVKLVDAATINKGTAATVLAEMWETGASAAQIVAAKGLAQVSDTSAILTAVNQVLDADPKTVQAYLGGKDKLFGALMGQVMKAMGGKANAQVVTEVLKQQLETRRG